LKRSGSGLAAFSDEPELFIASGPEAKRTGPAAIPRNPNPENIMKTKTASRPKARRSSAAPSLSPRDIQSILVPIDFSDPSRKALDYAAIFARQFKAKLTLLHVVEPVATPDFATFPLSMENDESIQIARKQLEKVAASLRLPRGTVEKTLVRFGRSFHEITEAARTRRMDLIIISTHGYTGFKHALLGSTTERVVRHAPCLVLVVRQG